MNLNEFANAVSNGSFDAKLKELCGPDDRQLLRNRLRYISAAENFSRLYPESSEIRVFSAPGRIDICGRPDGCLLSAAVDRDVFAIVSLNDDNIIRIKKEGGEVCEVRCDDAECTETGKLLSVIAAELDAELSGFNAYIQSDEIVGDSTEVLLRKIVESLFIEDLSGTSGSFPANAGHFGGIVLSDNRTEGSELRHIGYDLAGAGYSLCITGTGSNAKAAPAIGALNDVSSAMDEVSIADCEADRFYEKLPELRKVCADSSLLAAADYFAANERAELAAEALETGDSIEFFRIVGGSNEDIPQEIRLAVLVSRRELGENGAVCVNGSCDVLSFVPTYLAAAYTAEMGRIFGFGSCKTLSIRKEGCCELTL